MERELIVTGIGGQGVQLAAQVVARAAVHEGLQAQFFGLYEGAMRGMASDAMVVIADGPVTTPPIVPRADAAIALHHSGWAAVEPKLRPGATVLVNAPVFEGDLGHLDAQITVVEAARLATDAGAAMAASMVLVGAYAAATGVLPLDALVAGMRDALPPYRARHAETNAAALAAGFAVVGAAA